MRLVLHPKVSSDISKIMEFYEQVATAELADEFYRELRHFIHEAAERPESFAIRERDKGAGYDAGKARRDPQVTGKR